MVSLTNDDNRFRFCVVLLEIWFILWDFKLNISCSCQLKVLPDDEKIFMSFQVNFCNDKVC